VDYDQCQTCGGDAITVFDVDTQRMVVEHVKCPECKADPAVPGSPVSAIDDSDNAFFHLARLHEQCWDRYQASRRAAEQQQPLHLWHEGSFVSMVE
jgi:hypothetical protein